MLGIINRTKYLFGLTVLGAMAAAGGAGLKWSRMVEITDWIVFTINGLKW